MKCGELRPCDNCGGSIAPVFYRVSVQQIGLKLNEIKRHMGLAQFFGDGNVGFALANIMGTDPDIDQPIGNTVNMMLCTNCACMPDTPPIGALIERLAEKHPKEDNE